MQLLYFAVGVALVAVSLGILLIDLIVVAEGNLPSQWVAEKTGALREGVLRSRLRIHGVYHDAVMHSIVRPATTSATALRKVTPS
ncbi:MAG TPA: GNAT family protein [Thermoanaerobaculaceae bacterium]|nr:GNAT family protein [Thermoanaerobaculaceae bacterium]